MRLLNRSNTSRLETVEDIVSIQRRHRQLWRDAPPSETLVTCTEKASRLNLNRGFGVGGIFWELVNDQENNAGMIQL